MNRSCIVKYLVITMMIAGLMLGACGPSEPEVVERVVTEVVKETVVVQGTPEVVEREVTRIVTEEKEVEKEVTRVVEVEAEPAEESTEPIYGGTLRMATMRTPETWNPYQVMTCAGLQAMSQIYSALLRYDKDSNLVGDLAESWEWTDDTTLVFDLRRNVQWHNGDALVAEHVVKSQERRMDPGISNNAEYLNQIVDSWEALDDYTVKLTLKRPDIGILRYMTLAPGNAAIVHPNWDPATAGQSFETTIGTGPFMYDYFEPDLKARMVKNPNYFLEGQPYLDAIEILSVPEAEARLTGLRAGDFDIVTDVDFATYPVIQDDPDLYVPDAAGFYGHKMLFSFDDPPTDDVRVRHALNFAVDREMILDTVLAGFGKSIWGSIIPEGRFGYAPELANYYSYDPAKAIELLAEAGWTDTDGDGILDKDGQPMNLRYYTYGPSHWSQAAEVIQGNFREIGVECELIVVPWAEFAAERQRIADLPAGEPATYNIIGTTIWGLDMVGFFKYVGTGYIYNFNRYNNPEVNDLMAQALATTDDAEREALFIKIQQLVMDDAPWIANNWIVLAEGVNKQVKNFHHLNEDGCQALLMWETWLSQ